MSQSQPIVYDGPRSYDQPTPYEDPMFGVVHVLPKAVLTDKARVIHDATVDI
jgi:hypothetical protein